jgi:hypothetical protein
MKVINGKIVKSKSSTARELTSFYWGYNASQPGDGFEFCTEHLILSGYSRKQALQVGKIIKDAVDIQLAGIRGQDPMVLEGATVKEFLDQEQEQKIIEKIKNSLPEKTVEVKNPVKFSFDTYLDIISIGIEIDKDYCEVTKNRIKQTKE